MDRQLMTIEEVAEYLQVSSKTVYRMIHRREIPCYKVANQWRFKWDNLQHWMEESNYQPPRQAPENGSR